MAGEFQFLQDSAIALVVLVVIVAVGSIILVDIYNSGAFSNTPAQNVVNSGQSAIQEYASFFVVIVVIIIAVAILALLSYLQGRRAERAE